MIAKKRLLPILVAVLMVFAMMPMTAGTVFAESSGQLGDDIVWTMDDEGTLNIQLAEGVESAAIPDYTDNNSPFYQNNDIKAVVIGDGITKIGNNLFDGCAGLKSASLPEGMTGIGDFTFNDCAVLTSIDLPEGLQSIGRGAFAASGLRSIDMPNSVTEVGESAFARCFYLKQLKISAGLTEIGEVTFAACTRLKSLEIPEGVKVIHENAFTDCTELRELTLPASMEKIETQAFFDCISLEKVTFKGDFCVDMGAFYLCNFTAYYPLHNATWNEDTIDTGYGGKVKWEGYCLTHVNAAAVKENVKAATALKAGSYQQVVYCKQCGKEISRKTVTIAKLKPTIKLSATKKTLKKGKTYTLKVSKLAKGDAVKSFKTSKKSVATVTSKGKIKAKKKGKAVITVTLKSGKKATCKITVK